MIYRFTGNLKTIFILITYFEVSKNPTANRLKTISIITFLTYVTIILFEYFFLWTNDIINNAIVDNSSNVFIYKAWPPYICGILLGSLQLVSLLILEKSIGASRFYSTIMGVPICTKYLKEKFPYLAKFRSGLQMWLSLAFTIGCILGAFISSYVSFPPRLVLFIRWFLLI